MKYQVTPSIRLDEDSITFDFIRSSAPGGQNVNKVSSAVELRFEPTSFKLGLYMGLVAIAVAIGCAAASILIPRNRGQRLSIERQR